MSTEPSFQLAAESDASTLLEFMREYYAFDGHGFDPQKSQTALLTLLRDPTLGRSWLILDGDLPVGYIVLCLGYSLEFLGRDAFVDELYLRESHRRRGWGRKAMEFAEEAARSLGVTTIHLEVTQPNTVAKQFYHKLGFRDHEHSLMSKWIARGFAKPAGRGHH